MRNIAVLLSFHVLGFLVACEEDPLKTAEPDPQPVLEIRTGTSFGECAGYCFTELRVVDGQVELIRRSWNPQDPELVHMSHLSPAEWADLRAKASPKLLENVPAVLGCPDCADGGAEWVELITHQASGKVTFEFGNDVDELKEILPVLRALRTRFAEEAVP